MAAIGKTLALVLEYFRKFPSIFVGIGDGWMYWLVQYPVFRFTFPVGMQHLAVEAFFLAYHGVTRLLCGNQGLRMILDSASRGQAGKGPEKSARGNAVSNFSKTLPVRLRFTAAILFNELRLAHAVVITEWRQVIRIGLGR